MKKKNIREIVANWILVISFFLFALDTYYLGCRGIAMAISKEIGIGQGIAMVISGIITGVFIIFGGMIASYVVRNDEREDNIV